MCAHFQGCWVQRSKLNTASAWNLACKKRLFTKLVQERGAAASVFSHSQRRRRIPNLQRVWHILCTRYFWKHNNLITQPNLLTHTLLPNTQSYTPHHIQSTAHCYDLYTTTSASRYSIRYTHLLQHIQCIVKLIVMQQVRHMLSYLLITYSKTALQLRLQSATYKKPPAGTQCSGTFENHLSDGVIVSSMQTIPFNPSLQHSHLLLGALNTHIYILSLSRGPVPPKSARSRVKQSLGERFREYVRKLIMCRQVLQLNKTIFMGFTNHMTILYIDMFGFAMVFALGCALVDCTLVVGIKSCSF